MDVSPGVDQRRGAIIDQGAAARRTGAREVDRAAEGRVGRDVGEVEGAAAGDDDRGARQTKVAGHAYAHRAATDVEAVGEGGVAAGLRQQRLGQRDLAGEHAVDARARGDARAHDQHARQEVGRVGEIQGEVARVIGVGGAGADRDGLVTTVGVGAGEHQEARASLGQAEARGIADDAADVQLVAGDGHGRETVGARDGGEARTGHREAAHTLDDGGDGGGGRRVDVERAAGQGEVTIGRDRDRAAERAAADDVLGGGDGTVAGDVKETARNGELAGVGQGSGRERAREVGDARGDDLARDGHVGAVGEGADGGEGVGRDVAAVEGDDGAGEGAGQD